MNFKTGGNGRAFSGSHGPLGVCWPLKDIEDSGGRVDGGATGPKRRINIRSKCEQGKGGESLGHVASGTIALLGEAGNWINRIEVQ